ncbi:uncharacterized protein LOC127877346 isoform X2 [Dreissena polymorpha]|uniref:Egal-1 winged helix domain-containing protein n=2 Tax=Dreissena polymorpha TaxID=45954 RepID=A0A9D4MPM0_DREPO|nr:uncharacterized protein LOC127877346 isoform X2 [Dreissena polymorpha]KAH3880146.1 hypothetical protein DPMN_004059 [Dreissena polymorpha]
MADEPGHKAMLYFLEILMNSGQPLTISQLAGRFGSKTFTSDMRQACGGNESGLKKFLLKFPSLFCVSGNLVSLNDGTANLGKNFRESSPASTTSDVSVETEAVQYFRAKILKKGEKWLPVLSLAGHLSQASADIRECVGPQNEFKQWLERHPLIFDIRGDLVALKDNINYSVVNPSESLDLDDVQFNPNQRYSVGDGPRFSDSQPRTPKLKRRPKSIEIPPNSPKPSLNRTPSFTMQNLSTPLSAKSGPATMTANEYKAVMFLKGIIEKKGDMKLNGLTGHFSQAPESLRNTIGWSKPELEKFVCSHPNIFVISEDETVSVIKNARLNVIITGSRPSSNPAKAGKQGKGRVYHVAKLWGIIDLGKHEHVFIDRTIFGKQIDDLNKLLTVGEMVCFDSIPAAKGSRARWRATKVWKEHESIEDLIDKVTTRLGYPFGDSLREPMTPNSPMPIANIDEEIRRMIPELNDSSVIQSPVNVGGIKYSFSDAAPSGAGVVPVWNFGHQELSAMRDIDDLDLSDDSQSEGPSLSMVAEKYYMNRSVLSDTPKFENMASENGIDSKSSGKKSKSIGCQTIVTGEVLATQLFHEDM